MHTSGWIYIINAVYIPHVSATPVAIVREMRYEKYINMLQKFVT
jgi:hypothetical protein